METSASPLVHIEGRLLVFQDEKIEASVLRTINSTYNPHKFSSESNETIERILKECWKNDLISTIDIYNVGHGNADYIRGPHRRILYDIGYNYRCYPGPKHYQTRFWKAVTAIRHLKPNCVILSHWDLDHIIGCAYSQGNVFDVPWIAPHLVASKSEKASTNSIRLAHYLASTKKLHLVDRTQPEQLIATIRAKKNVKIKLWLGKGKSICSLKNREGLFVEISGSLHVLLGGDVPYSCMPGSIFGNQIDYMHVPHHCSSMELRQLRRLKNKGKLAAISTNRFKNGNLNCCGSHHDALERVFDKVMSTIDDPGGNDEKNLSIQLSYQNKYYRVR
ncbi:hypothetical protein [Allofournierella massiliensis]|uniref:Metallo-beta-lactamase superfamily protein n=1 Tax=Allofournierella massiliensis TaxID=1650663 RepID=A0ABT7USS3_9FIRM|nr:hypothetical protein [Fournierella massiliensis]MDM8201941.1 hypothetical protein [Fournierella massiliensis]